jgi:hypothetical protein
MKQQACWPDRGFQPLVQRLEFGARMHAPLGVEVRWRLVNKKDSRMADNVSVLGLHSIHTPPVDFNVARRGAFQSGHHAQERRFSTAGGANKNDALAAFNAHNDAKLGGRHAKSIFTLRIVTEPIPVS